MAMYRQRQALDPILERQRHGGKKAKVSKDGAARREIESFGGPLPRRRRDASRPAHRRVAPLGIEPQPPRDARAIGAGASRWSVPARCDRLAPVLELLLDEEDGLNADPNLATPSGLHATHLAAEYDNSRPWPRLIRHGGDLQAREHAFDRMPVHVAAAYAGPVTVMSLVIETGRQIEDEMLDAARTRRRRRARQRRASR